MAADGTEATGRVAAVLLQFLREADTVSVSAVAREIGVSKAVVHRILRTLVASDLIRLEPESRMYMLGPAAVALGARALRGSDLRQLSLPLLHDLVELTGETATVSALINTERVYLDQVESRQEIKMTVELGRRFPLHAGSSGRAILAFGSPNLLAEVLAASLEAVTEQTIVDPEQLRAVLTEVRTRGVAESDGERHKGAASLAAPVFDVDGQVVGSMSVCGPIARFTHEDRVAATTHLTDAADHLSREMGWIGGIP